MVPGGVVVVCLGALLATDKTTTLFAVGLTAVGALIATAVAVAEPVIEGDRRSPVRSFEER